MAETQESRMMMLMEDHQEDHQDDNGYDYDSDDDDDTNSCIYLDNGDIVKRYINVALIGSSGGGTATLGHTKPVEFMRLLDEEFKTKVTTSSKSSPHLTKTEPPMLLKFIMFLVLDNGNGFDTASLDDKVTLYFHNEYDKDCREHMLIEHGTLREINEKMIHIQKTILADMIGRYPCDIDALICVSCKPDLFHHTFVEAHYHGTPVTGTGGSSLSTISSIYDLKLIGNAGGSVATTPYTKAISFTYALSKHFNLTYQPWLKNNTNGSAVLPTWRSVLNSCLPAFWVVALCKRFLLLLQTRISYPSLSFLMSQDSVDTLVYILECHTLPMVCSIMMANSRRRTTGNGTSISSSDDTSNPGLLMNAIIASCSCKKTVVGGLLAGYFVTYLEEYMLYFCILYVNIPATMTNLLTNGFVGMFVGLFIMTPLVPYLALLTETLRVGIGLLVTSVDDDQPNMEVLRCIILSFVGVFFCYGSKLGWYHLYFLPIILMVEMECGDPSILGAIDELTLVLVCAGICSATWLHRKVLSHKNRDNDVLLYKRGVYTNLLCGDFIEVCYPLMKQNTIVNVGGYVASACSVSILTENCKSSAYVPLPLSIWLADDMQRMAIAAIVAFCISFVFTIVGEVIYPSTSKQSSESDESESDASASEREKED